MDAKLNAGTGEWIFIAGPRQEATGYSLVCDRLIQLMQTHGEQTLGVVKEGDRVVLTIVDWIGNLFGAEHPYAWEDGRIGARKNQYSMCVSLPSGSNQLPSRRDLARAASAKAKELISAAYDRANAEGETWVGQNWIDLQLQPSEAHEGEWRELAEKLESGRPFSPDFCGVGDGLKKNLIKLADETRGTTHRMSKASMIGIAAVVAGVSCLGYFTFSHGKTTKDDRASHRGPY